MNEYKRSIQQWRRAYLACAYRTLASSYHSGMSSKGYAKMCQAQRILDKLGYRPSAFTSPYNDPEVRSTTAAVLWKHRREIVSNW